MKQWLQDGENRRAVYRFRERKQKADVNGYFTVEAAMVMPMVLAMILLVIYLWFFQYDRCLTELDGELLLVRWATEQGWTHEERAKGLGEELTSWYTDHYAAYEAGEASVLVKNNRLMVSRSGSVRFPFSGLNFWSEENLWGWRMEKSAEILNAPQIIRVYRELLAAGNLFHNKD